MGSRELLGGPVLSTPTSRCRVGLGRVDITPPVGIYHRFWGAARHDRAEGVHRPLTATVLLLASLEGGAEEKVVVAVDHCLFRPDDMEAVLSETSRLVGVDRSRLTFTFSHTHSGGHIARERLGMPGGEFIGPYLDALPAKIAEAYRNARSSVKPAVFTYGSTLCSMGNNRDFYDAQSGQFVCGLNADQPEALPVQVVRITGDEGQLMGTIVSYPCHPTTLAWENRLISPDYVGALRETVETVTGAPCVFLLAPCGDIGPRHGFVGNPAVADRNGRQVAYAALEAFEGLGPPGHDFHYAGPVISGATLGTWGYRPHSEKRRQETATFRWRRWEIPLTFRPDLAEARGSEVDLADLEEQAANAAARGNDRETRDLRAMAERQRRLLERVRPLAQMTEYPYVLEALQIGDAFWVFVEGEPYYALQKGLSERFPPFPVLGVTLANGSRASYLPTQAAYEKPLYQVDVAVLASGCLERVEEALAGQLAEWGAGHGFHKS